MVSCPTDGVSRPAIAAALKSLVPLLVALSSTTAPAAPNPGPLGTFQDPTSVRILADQGPAKRVEFAVRLAEGVDPAAIQVFLDGVFLDGLQDTSFKELFSVTWNAGARVLSVNIELRPALRPGSYQLRARLRGTVNQKPQEQTETLVVVVPAATLRSLGTLQIRRTRWFWGPPAVTSAVLRLQETSRLSRVTEVGVLSVGGNGCLVFKPRSIAPGEVVDLPVEFEGQFPLGSSKGTIQVTASQLAQPYEVAYEVITTWTKWLLVVVIGFGILVGYLIKTRITGATKLSEARLQAAKVLEDLESQPYRDQEFRDDLKSQRDALHSALDDGDVGAITERAASAREALRVALEGLRKRKADVQNDLAGLWKLVEGQWDLPESIDAALEHGRQARPRLQGLLDQGDVGAAETELAALRREVGTLLHKAVLAWRQQLLDGLGRLPTKSPPLGTLFGDVRRAAEKACVDKLSALDAHADLESALRAVRDARTLVNTFLEAIVRDLEAMVGQVQANLGGLGDLGPTFGELDELGKSRMGDPDILLPALNHQSSRLHDALRHAVGAVASQDPQVDQLLQAGRYEEAASLAQQTAKRPASGPVQAAAPTAAQPAAGPPGVVRRGSAEPSESPVREAKFFIWQTPSIPMLPRAAVIKTQARAELRAAKRLNTTVAAVLAIVTGYLVFENSFVGSLDNIAAAFVWALGVDASVEVLVETLKKKIGGAT